VGQPLVTVLLVEDNPTDVFVIKGALESCDFSFQLRIAPDGRDAIQYLQDIERDPLASCPDLVLLDLNLPKVDGFEVLRQLRQVSRCSGTPVIVVTSSTAEADRTAAQRWGAEAYFQKPTSLAAYMGLADVIKRVLRLPGTGRVAEDSGIHPKQS
jgi:CheY-like chemotaxis protein